MVAGGRLSTQRSSVASGALHLTERGLLAVIVAFGLLAAVSVAVILGSFLAVSNAPLDAQSGIRVTAAGR